MCWAHPSCMKISGKTSLIILFFYSLNLFIFFIARGSIHVRWQISVIPVSEDVGAEAAG